MAPVPGQALEVRDPATDDLVLSVTVTDVLPDVSCADPAVTSRNGSLVAVRITVTTGADLSALGGERSVAPGGFDHVGRDGTVIENLTPVGSCATRAAAFPGGPLAPSSEMAGTVVLDVPGRPGSVRFHPEWPATGGV